MYRIVFSVCMVLLTLQGCATQMATAKHHQSAAKLPSNFVYIPVDVKVSKFGVGSLTEMPDQSAQAREMVSREIKKYISENLDSIPLELREISGEDHELVSEYTGLYDITAGAAIQSQTAGAGWQHKQKKFDYTLGPGVSFIKEYTDSNTALFVVGQNYISTGGRKLTAFFAAALGVVVPLGHSFLHVGFVDLDSGKILWTNSVFSQTLNLRDQQNVESIVKTLFQSYSS